MLGSILIKDNKEFRLFYSATGFAKEVTVTGYLIYPNVEKSPVLNFDELGDGIYTVVVKFDKNTNPLTRKKKHRLMDKYCLLIKENGIVKYFEVFSFTCKGAEI